MIFIPENDDEYINYNKKFVLNFQVKKSPGALRNINGYKIHRKNYGLLRQPFVGICRKCSPIPTILQKLQK